MNVFVQPERKSSQAVRPALSIPPSRLGSDVSRRSTHASQSPVQQSGSANSRSRKSIISLYFGSFSSMPNSRAKKGIKTLRLNVSLSANSLPSPET